MLTLEVWHIDFLMCVGPDHLITPIKYQSWIVALTLISFWKVSTRPGSKMTRLPVVRLNPPALPGSTLALPIPNTFRHQASVFNKHHSIHIIVC